MSSLTNSNDYKRGWEEGRQDALDGKDKNYSRMGMSWKFVFHGNSALERYAEGYDKGYEAGLNENQVVRKVEIINSTNDMDNSSRVQDLLREMEALKDLNDFLVVYVCDRVRQVNGLFEKYIEIMAGTGVLVQACETFRTQYYQKDMALFKRLFERIIQYDLPQIRKYIEMLKSQFRVATGRDIGSINLRLPGNSVSVSLPSNAVLTNTGDQSFDVQINAVCNLMDFLVSQRNELQETIRKYEEYCKAMVSNGVPKEITEHYIPNFALENVRLIKNTYGHIQSEDYPYLSKVYAEIANSLAQTNKSPNRSPKAM